MVVVAAALALGASACSLFSPAYRDASGQVTATASVSISSLKVGDCVFNVSNLGSQITKVQVVPCSSSHEGEVFATETSVPNVASDIADYCTNQFALYIGLDFNSSSLTAKYFSNASPSAADTDVQCMVFSPGVMVTQSYKDSQQ